MLASFPKKKVTILGPNLNPELEKIRDSVLSVKHDNENVSFHLLERTQRVHASYLFHELGRYVLGDLCRIMSSTPPSFELYSWKNLAANLGISSLNIQYITNTYMSIDPTEKVLATFAQNEDATLGQIVIALDKMNRFDAISYIKSGFEDLERIAREEQIQRTNDIAPYYEGRGTPDGILRPHIYQNFSRTLPIALRKYSKEINKDDRIIKYRALSQRKVSKFSKSVLLSFSSDGIEIAYRVAQQFRQQRGTYLPIGVLILDEHCEKVLSNPESFIIHWFSQVSYVVPIVTEGYLNSLKDEFEEESSNHSCIDVQYTRFIHDLMLKYYKTNNCMNDKVRCIIPNENYSKILKSKHMSIDPIFRVYFKETEIEHLANLMLK